MVVKFFKLFIIACILLLIPTVFIFAGGEKEAETHAAVNEIEFWTTGASRDKPTYDDVIEQFEAKHPGLKVKFSLYYEWRKYRDKMLVALSSGTGPDAMVYDGGWLPEWASSGVLDPAPEFVIEDLKTNYVKGLIPLLTHEGKVYGYPWLRSLHALYWNKKLFRDAGLDPEKSPRTYNELRSFSKKLTQYDNTGEITQAGYWINKRLMYFCDWLYNNGARLMNEDEYGNMQSPMHGTLTTPKALEAWRFLYSIYQVDKSGSFKIPDRTKSFPTSQVAMCQTGAFLIPSILEAAPDLDFGVGELPINPPNVQKQVVQIGGWLAGVNSSADVQSKKLGWEFNSLLMQKEMDGIEISYHQPCRLDSYKDPRMQQLSHFDYFNKLFLEGKAHLTTKPKTPYWGEILERIEPLIEKMLVGELKPEEAAEKSNEILNSVLDEAGVLNK